MRPWPLDRVMIREGAASDPAKPGNQPWTNVKPRGAVRARGPSMYVRALPSVLSLRPRRPGVWPQERTRCV